MNLPEVCVDDAMGFLFILLVVIAATGYLLYRVMASFLLPLFLAVVLTVIFRPLHDWMLRTMPQPRTRGRPADHADRSRHRAAAD